MKRTALNLWSGVEWSGERELEFDGIRRGVSGQSQPVSDDDASRKRTGGKEKKGEHRPQLQRRGRGERSERGRPHDQHRPCVGREQRRGQAQRYRNAQRGQRDASAPSPSVSVSVCLCCPLIALWPSRCALLQPSPFGPALLPLLRCWAGPRPVHPHLLLFALFPCARPSRLFLPLQPTSQRATSLSLSLVTWIALPTPRCVGCCDSNSTTVSPPLLFHCPSTITAHPFLPPTSFLCPPTPR